MALVDVPYEFMVYDMVYGMVYNIVYGMVYGMVYNIVYGMVYNIVYGMFYDMVYDIVYGVVYGIVYGIRTIWRTQLILDNLFCSTVPFHTCIFDPYVIIYLAHMSSFITGGPCAASAYRLQSFGILPLLRSLRMLKRS